MKKVLKIKPLYSDILSEYKINKLTLDVLEKEIEARLEYIINTIFHEFKINERYYVNDLNFVLNNINNGFVEFDFNSSTNMFIFYKKDIHNLKSGLIPENWLYEDFEEELKFCKKAYDDYQKQIKKDKIKKLKEIKKKLTQEEMAILIEESK